MIRRRLLQTRKRDSVLFRTFKLFSILIINQWVNNLYRVYHFNSERINCITQ